MGAWRRPGLIHSLGQKLVKGMLDRGYPKEFAEGLYKQIQGFGEYGFPESHAASFALLGWVSAWLKRHEPACFTAALLNSQPMGFYAPAQLVRDARTHGVPTRPVDVTRSRWDCTLEPMPPQSPRSNPTDDPRSWGKGGPALRLGLRMVKGFSEDVALRLVTAREARPFDSVEDCKRRARLSNREAKLLASAGAFSALISNRRTASWDAALPRDDSPLFRDLPAEPEPRPRLRAPVLAETIAADYLSTGLSVFGHPVAVFRSELARAGIRPAVALPKIPHGRFVTVAGVVINRQRPGTANGILFMTLEDETGHINLILHPSVQERFRREVLGGRLLAVRGRLERSHDVTHLVVSSIEDLTHLIARIPTPSRDFC
jgi:error-prone DNA polymerase